jgi:hypothetical protein
MQVIEAQCASILVPHDHLHINQIRAWPANDSGPTGGLWAQRHTVHPGRHDPDGRVGGQVALGEADPAAGPSAFTSDIP